MHPALQVTENAGELCGWVLGTISATGSSVRREITGLADSRIKQACQSPGRPQPRVSTGPAYTSLARKTKGAAGSAAGCRMVGPPSWVVM